MLTPYTLDNLRKSVLVRLNEAADSPVGEFHSGDGGAAVISTQDTITQYLNDAAYDLAKSCYPVFDRGTAFLLPTTRSVALQSFVTASQGTLWAVRQVSLAGVPLERINRSYAEIYYPEFAHEGTGLSKYWYFDGTGSIGFAPISLVGGALTVTGLVTPKPLVAATDTVDWLQPDLYKLLTYYAAYMIAMKNLENPGLKEKAQVWQTAYIEGRNNLLSKLAAEDPKLMRAHFLVADKKF